MTPLSVRGITDEKQSTVFSTPVSILSSPKSYLPANTPHTTVFDNAVFLNHTRIGLRFNSEALNVFCLRLMSDGNAQYLRVVCDVRTQWGWSPGILGLSKLPVYSNFGRVLYLYYHIYKHKNMLLKNIYS